jgi:hypothetical protein
MVMHPLMKGTLILVVGTLCSCTAPNSDKPKASPAIAAAAPLTGAAPAQIRQVLLAGESGVLNSAARPQPVTPETPISITVSVENAGTGLPAVSLRLIDLKNGQVVGEQTMPIATGANSVQFDFKPTQPWSEGRHLLEARLGPTGKVFQREFDVVPAVPAASPKPAAAS